jgi:hypothetical protein
VAAQLTSLIDKQDTFEIVRDQVAAILLEESLRQRELAIEADKNPELWELRVYAERSNPYSDWQQVDDEDARAEVDPHGRARTSPIVNVWFDQATTDLHRSNLIERQTVTGVFNVDCFGLGVSAEGGPSGGHIAGDAAAVRSAQRAARLARNILMAGAHSYLQLRGTVSRRWVQSLQVFQPQIEQRTIQHVVGARLSLHVDFNEFSPQVEGQPIELISVGVRRLSDGLLYFTANYPHGV